MDQNAEFKEKLACDDAFVRREACEQIAEERNPVYIPELVGLLDDEDLGVKEASINALMAIGGSPVAEAIAPLLRKDDPALRNIGVEILESIGQEAVDTITGLLEDSDDDVVKFAVDILSSMPGDARIDTSLTSLVSHSNPNVRASVALCLGKSHAAEAVPVLLRALGDSEEWVKFSAIEGLGLLGGRKSVEALFGVIENETGLIRDAALEAVARVADRDDSVALLPKVRKILKEGDFLSPVSIVDLIEKALMPGSTFKADPGFKEVFFAFFSSSLEEANRAVQMASLKGLGLVRTPQGLTRIFEYSDSLREVDEETGARIVDSVASIVGHDPLPSSVLEQLSRGGRNRAFVIRALGELKSIDAVPHLEALLGDATRDELREIVTALESIGSTDSIDALTRLLGNKDGHTRKTAARALSRLAGAAAVPELFRALKDEVYRDVMEEITDLLSMIPNEQTRDCFAELLKSPGEELREMAARGLGKVAYDDTLPLLRRAASDESASVRKAAYKSMAVLGNDEAEQDVIRGLDDEDHEVRLSVLKGLGNWQGPGVTGAVLRMIEDEDVWVRYHAVNVLGMIGDQSCEDRLLHLLAQDEPPVKAAAAVALERVGTEKSIEVLAGLLDHEDSNVRGAVERAIETLSC